MTVRRLACSIAMVLVFWGCGRSSEEKRDHYIALGDKYLEQGNYGEASIFFRKAIQEDRRHADAYYKYGLTSWHRSQHQRAVEAFRRAFELDPDNLDAFRKLGDVYFASSIARATGVNQVAIDAMVALTERAEEGHPTAKEVLYMKGRILIASRKFEDAVPYLEQAYAVDQEDTGVALTYSAAQARAGMPEEAEKTARRILESHQEDGSIYDFLFRFYAETGRVKEAGEILAAKTVAIPDQAANWIMLASFHRSQGREDEAEKILRSLTQQPEKFPNAWATIGDYYAGIGDGEAAVRSYEKGIESNPEKEELYRYRLIYAHLSQGDTSTASQAIDRILEKNDDDYRAIGLRGMLHLYSGDRTQLDLALEDLRIAAAELPENAAMRYQYGRALFLSGDPHGAELQLREAIQKDPELMPARYSLLDLHLSEREFSEATLVAEQILENQPLDGNARLALALARIGLGRNDEARRHLSILVKQKQRVADAVWHLGRLDLTERKFAAAEAHFQSLIEATPPDPRGTQGLLEVYVAQNRIEQARTILVKEIRERPDNGALRVLAARLALSAQDREEAVEQLNEAVRLNPRHGQANQHLAEIALAAGDVETAVKHLKIAIESEPPIPDAFFRYGTILQLQGDIQGARRNLERCIDLEPDHSNALNNLAFVLADLGSDLGLAVTYAQRAVARHPDNTDYSDTLGYVYIKRELYQNAIDTLEKVVKDAPQRGDYRYHLGLALFHAGKTREAARELREAQGMRLSSSDAGAVNELLAQIGG